MDTILALLLFLSPLAYSPGPGNLFFAANGARFGVLATMPASFGYHLATLIVTLAIGLGFLTLLEKVPALFEVIRWAGAAFVLWLAIKLIRAGRLSSQSKARPAGFIDGAVLLILNPKAYAIIALMFTQFLSSGLSALTIAVLFTANNFVAFTIWTWAGDRLAALFASEIGAARLNTGLGLALAAVAIWMLLG